jgi:hypothetical protein
MGLREISGMGAPGWPSKRAITEVAEGFEIFRADHSERMSSMISGSEMAGAEQRCILGKCIHDEPRYSEPLCGRSAGHCPIPSKGTSGWKKYQNKNSTSPGPTQCPEPLSVATLCRLAKVGNWLCAG